MLCERCRQKTALFRYLKIEDGESTDLCLCAACAEKLGKPIEFGALDIGAAVSELVGLESFFVFTNGGETAHTDGRIYEKPGKEGALLRLKSELKEAIDSENYESAAKLRDRIAAAEGKEIK